MIQPSLEDIQNAVNTAVQCVTDIGQYIHLWTLASPASSLNNTPRSEESNISTCIYIYIYVSGNVIKMENSLLAIFDKIWPMTLYYYSTGTLARFWSNFKNS